MMTTEQALTNQARLNQELREFFELYASNMIFRPSADETIAAVEPHFPELVEDADHIDEILDDCGIAVIADIGSQKFETYKRISCSVADNEADAQSQLEKYGNSPYKEIRVALNINYHWVLRMDESLRFYNSNTLVEASIDFESFEKPDICIIELE